jgi:hypothetical protein
MALVEGSGFSPFERFEWVLVACLGMIELKEMGFCRNLGFFRLFEWLA